MDQLLVRLAEREQRLPGKKNPLIPRVQFAGTAALSCWQPLWERCADTLCFSLQYVSLICLGGGWLLYLSPQELSWT